MWKGLHDGPPPVASLEENSRRSSGFPVLLLGLSVFSLSWAGGPGREGLSPSYENDLRIGVLISRF